MKQKIGSLLVLGFGLIGSLSAQELVIQKLNLEQVQEKVITGSHEIRIAKEALHRSEFHVKNAKMDRLPDLAITGSIDKASNFPIYENGLFSTPSQHEVIHTLYATNSNMYLTLYEGLRKKNTIQLKEIEHHLEEELLEEKQAAVKMNAIQLFLELYLQNEWKRLIQADIDEKMHQLKEIQDLFEMGVVLQSDVLRAELELSKRRMTLIEIENQVLKVNQQLNVLIGNPDDQLVEPFVELGTLPSIGTIKESLDKSQLAAYAQRQSHYHVLAAEKQVDLAKATNKIKLGMTGSFQFSNPQIFLYPYNDAWYNLGLVGLKASYSISELYKNKPKVSSAKVGVKLAHEQHEKVNDDIRTRIYQDYLAYDESLKYIDIYRLNEKYALENARILKDAYFNQTSLITDLLDADVLVLKSKFELKQGQVNALKNYYRLQFSKGTL